MEPGVGVYLCPHLIEEAGDLADLFEAVAANVPFLIVEARGCVSGLHAKSWKAEKRYCGYVCRSV
jgi:hypothetical protein